MTHQAATHRAWTRPLLYGLAIAALAVALPRIQPLLDSLWWYPETGAYQVWVMALTLLAILSQRFGARTGAWRVVLTGCWILALALVLVGLCELVDHAITHRTAGDLFQNYLEGARRVAAGDRVYDLKGLHQGVNASPVALAMFGPLARLSNAQALTIFLLVDLLALALYAGAAAALVRRIKGALTLADLGVAVAGAMAFFSMQRSWRLGQLDTVLLALLTLSLALCPARLSSALSLALATALKVVPSVAAAPWLLGALRLRWPGAAPPAANRRWAVTYLGSVALLVTVGAVVVGPDNAIDFLRNTDKITEGTTSGNNYAVAARLDSWGDAERRHRHSLLSAGGQLLSRALSVITALVLGLLSVRLGRASPSLLASLWLTAVPLLSPVCWDIYLVWCSFLPWLVAWAHVTGRPELIGVAESALQKQLSQEQLSPLRRVRALKRLVSVATVGSYLLAGALGNTTHRDLLTGYTVHLGVPYWFNELPLLGHLITITLLVFLAARSHRLDGAPPDGMKLQP